MSDELCPICKNKLHSIIIRRVGDIAVCRDCGDKLIPIMNGIAAAFVSNCSESVAFVENARIAIQAVFRDFEESQSTLVIPVEYAERIEIALNAR